MGTTSSQKASRGWGSGMQQFSQPTGYSNILRRIKPPKPRAPVPRSSKLDGSGITNPLLVSGSNWTPGVPLNTTDIAVPSNFAPAGHHSLSGGSGLLARIEPVPSSPDQTVTRSELSENW